jgi:hypothetical protein
MKSLPLLMDDFMNQTRPLSRCQRVRAALRKAWAQLTAMDNVVEFSTYARLALRVASRGPGQFSFLVQAFREALRGLPEEHQVAALEQIRAALSHVSTLTQLRQFAKRAPRLAQIDFTLQVSQEDPTLAAETITQYTFYDVDNHSLSLTVDALSRLPDATPAERREPLESLASITGYDLSSRDALDAFQAELDRLCFCVFDEYHQTWVVLRARANTRPDSEPTQQ